MNSKFIALATLSIAVLATSACTSNAHTARSLPPGEYNSKTKTTDSNGTDRSVQTKTTVGYDQYGHKKAVVEKETTTDPKGLFNKSKTKSTQVAK